ncbi:unnamed protein product [Candida parapsilosis]
MTLKSKLDLIVFYYLQRRMRISNEHFYFGFLLRGSIYGPQYNQHPDPSEGALVVLLLRKEWRR